MSDEVIKPRLAIVVPCYNEEAVVVEAARMFMEELDRLASRGEISGESFILFSNDGSSDATWRFVTELAADNPCVRGLSLSRNCGHQNALLAGLMEVRDCCDVAVSMDCDGQDDIGAMSKMIEANKAGAEIVYGVRNSRATDTWLKRNCARGFYRLLHWLGAEVVYDHADYRLVSARVLREFSRYEEVNLFLRGMFPLIGFKTAVVYYDRLERTAGKSHYPLARQLALAANGITSLSIKPIRIIMALGLFVSFLSFCMIAWSFISHACGNTVPGWTSCILVSSFLGGVQLISLGVIGEYVGKTYLEAKHRPRYIVSERTPK